MANPTAKYQSLSKEAIREQLEALSQVWDIFLKRYEKSQYKECLINKDDLVNVIYRVDKRKDYYYYYHDIEDGHMSEYKEIALISYWIIKLKPFQMINQTADLYSWANETFALYLILSMLKKEAAKSGQSIRIPSGKYLKELKYSLKYRDYSKEALIDLVEGFSQCLVENTPGDVRAS
jgi:hypothetical protein